MRLLAVVSALAAVSTVAAAAAGGHGPASIHVNFAQTATMSGEIQSLRTKRILVSGLRCAIPAKVAVSADRFVIGDPVKITCVDGILRTVKYSPQLDPGATYSTHSGSQPAVTTPPTSKSGSPVFGTSAVYTVSTVVLGSSTVEQQVTATGTISAVSGDSVTVGDLTCSMPPGLPLPGVVAVDDRATLSCGATSGTLTHLSGSR